MPVAKLAIGVTGFEPTTSASQKQRSTKLSYTPLSRFLSPPVLNLPKGTAAVEWFPSQLRYYNTICVPCQTEPSVASCICGLTRYQ